MVFVRDLVNHNFLTNFYFISRKTDVDEGEESHLWHDEIELVDNNPFSTLNNNLLIRNVFLSSSVDLLQ